MFSTSQNKHCLGDRIRRNGEVLPFKLIGKVASASRRTKAGDVERSAAARRHVDAADIQAVVLTVVVAVDSTDVLWLEPLLQCYGRTKEQGKNEV